MNIFKNFQELYRDSGTCLIGMLIEKSSTFASLLPQKILGAEALSVYVLNILPLQQATYLLAALFISFKLYVKILLP